MNGHIIVPLSAYTDHTAVITPNVPLGIIRFHAKIYNYQQEKGSATCIDPPSCNVIIASSAIGILLALHAVALSSWNVSNAVAITSQG